jgi:hypothetical protein
LKIAPGPVVSTLISGLEFTGGVAVDPVSGDVFVAENLGLPTFENRIRRFTSTGVPVPPVPFAGPSFSFGSVDLVVAAGGRLLASGNFGQDVVAFDLDGGPSSTFASGLTFATGMTADPFTQRVQILSSTFSGGAEDRSLHRFTPIDQLAPGKGSAATECLHELYGVALVDKAAVCVDGAACDGDGAVNDVCVFPIGFCFNVEDADFPLCDAGATISSVEISAKPSSAAIQEVAQRIVTPLSAPTCAFSDGLAVPVKTTNSGPVAGAGKVKVRTTAQDGRKDTDVFKLVCEPAP